jgi:hypothetical protein
LTLDLQAFFDTMPHALLVRAVRKHTDCRWGLLYMERWLEAPVQLGDGTLEPREKGSPQGSGLSPLLSNLFLHYTCDRCMALHHPSIPFERYCKDDDRRGHYPNEQFDSLGYAFGPRRSKNRWGKSFVNFRPGLSNSAAQAIRRAIRSWRLACRIDKKGDDLARMFNPVIRGWITYSGRSYKSALYPTLRYREPRLARWAMSKYKRLRRHRRRSEPWIRRIARRAPGLFAHWRLLYRATAGQ